MPTNKNASNGDHDIDCMVNMNNQPPGDLEEDVEKSMESRNDEGNVVSINQNNSSQSTDNEYKSDRYRALLSMWQELSQRHTDIDQLIQVPDEERYRSISFDATNFRDDADDIYENSGKEEKPSNEAIDSRGVSKSNLQPTDIDSFLQAPRKRRTKSYNSHPYRRFHRTKMRSSSRFSSYQNRSSSIIQPALNQLSNLTDLFDKTISKINFRNHTAESQNFNETDRKELFNVIPLKEYEVDFDTLVKVGNMAKTASGDETNNGDDKGQIIPAKSQENSEKPEGENSDKLISSFEHSQQYHDIIARMMRLKNDVDAVVSSKSIVNNDLGSVSKGMKWKNSNRVFARSNSIAGDVKYFKNDDVAKYGSSVQAGDENRNNKDIEELLGVKRATTRDAMLTQRFQRAMAQDDWDIDRIMNLGSSGLPSIAPKTLKRRYIAENSRKMVQAEEGSKQNGPLIDVDILFQLSDIAEYQESTLSNQNNDGKEAFPAKYTSPSIKTALQSPDFQRNVGHIRSTLGQIQYHYPESSDTSVNAKSASDGNIYSLTDTPSNGDENLYPIDIDACIPDSEIPLTSAIKGRRATIGTSDQFKSAWKNGFRKFSGIFQGENNGQSKGQRKPLNDAAASANRYDNSS